MIALKDSLPFVQFQPGSSEPFEMRWLQRELLRAAEKAGHSKWWAAEHIAASVANYLCQEFDENVIPARELEDAVRRVLAALEHKDVAEALSLKRPPVRISLADLAREAGAGYELVFFEILRERLRGVLRSNVDAAELCDLGPCVRLLRSARSWRQGCDRLRNEIVTFVHAELDRVRKINAFSLQLS